MHEKRGRPLFRRFYFHKIRIPRPEENASLSIKIQSKDKVERSHRNGNEEFYASHRILSLEKRCSRLTVLTHVMYNLCILTSVCAEVQI